MRYRIYINKKVRAERTITIDTMIAQIVAMTGYAIIFDVDGQYFDCSCSQVDYGKPRIYSIDAFQWVQKLEEVKTTNS